MNLPTTKPLKQGLLHLYYAVTAHERRARLRRMVEQAAAPVCILFYHRVADSCPNDWTLPTQTFERQIDWLAKRFDLVSLAQAQRRLAAGVNQRPAVAITFDDGYADNCEFAIPLLLRRNLPFTYFVTTNIIQEQSAFPHDLAAGVPLKPNSLTEIRAMADAGVEIGAHTRTHPDLGASDDPAWLDDEIAGSKQDLQQWIGREVRYFAFPFGLQENAPPAAFAAAARAGFQGVCTAYGAYNLPATAAENNNVFHLRRIHADPEWARFKNWMTFDPRKFAMVDPIDDSALPIANTKQPAAMSTAFQE